MPRTLYVYLVVYPLAFAWILGILGTRTDVVTTSSFAYGKLLGVIVGACLVIVATRASKTKTPYSSAYLVLPLMLLGVLFAPLIHAQYPALVGAIAVVGFTYSTIIAITVYADISQRGQRSPLGVNGIGACLNSLGMAAGIVLPLLITRISSSFPVTEASMVVCFLLVFVTIFMFRENVVLGVFGLSDTEHQHLTVAQQCELLASRHNLTSRQGEVLLLMVSGNAEKEIAAALSISSNTVHEHVKTIYKKLDVHSHADLFSRLLQESDSKA